MSHALLLYQTEDGRTHIQVCLENETVLLTPAAMAEVFQTTLQNIPLHLKNIFAKGKLDKAATCQDFLQVQTEGPLVDGVLCKLNKSGEA